VHVMQNITQFHIKIKLPLERSGYSFTSRPRDVNNKKFKTLNCCVSFSLVLIFSALLNPFNWALLLSKKGTSVPLQARGTQRVPEI